MAMDAVMYSAATVTAAVGKVSNIFDPGFWTPELVSGFGEALTGRKKRSTEEIAVDLDHFSSFDINGDGFISVNEITEMFGIGVDNFFL